MLILVVEDEAIVAYVVGKMLTEVGHQILGPARNACTALKCIAVDRPDLALVDLILPGGTSGADLARCMLQLYGIPSIFMSAIPDECRQVATFSGSLGCLRKPFTEHELITAVGIAQAIITGQPSVRPSPSCLELYG